jgi:tol-pal system protein YbgF
MEDSKTGGAGTDSTEIDQLLGSDKSSTGDSEESINEDDVLRLLGVNEESNPEGSIAQSEASGSETSTAFDNSGNIESSPGFAASKTDQSMSNPGQASAKTDRATPAWRSDSYADRYQEALLSYRSKNFGDAIQKFEALLAANSKHALADNCQYWIGEAYYDQGNFTQAIVAFEKVFTFSSSNKDDSAQLKLGLCYYKMNDKTKAKDEFLKLINNYPTSEYISIAKRFIAQIGGPSPSP